MNFLLLETGDAMLQEDGFKIVLNEITVVREVKSINGIVI